MVWYEAKTLCHVGREWKNKHEQNNTIKPKACRVKRNLMNEKLGDEECWA